MTSRRGAANSEDAGAGNRVREDRRGHAVAVSVDRRSRRGAELAIAMAEVFAGEIDFNSDLQPGDRYVVSFERVHT